MAESCGTFRGRGEAHRKKWWERKKSADKGYVKESKRFNPKFRFLVDRRYPELHDMFKYMNVTVRYGIGVDGNEIEFKLGPLTMEQIETWKLNFQAKGFVWTYLDMPRYK